MLSFENFVKSMPPSLSELKVTSSFCFAFKIPDDRAVTTIYYLRQIYGGDFAKICGLLRIYELNHLEYSFLGWMTYKKQIKMISALMNYSMSCLAMNNITNTSKCNFTL